MAQSASDLCDLCDLRVKNPIKRGIHTEIAKSAKERTTIGSQGVTESASDLCDLCDLRVKNPIKREFTQRSQRTQRSGQLRIEGVPNPHRIL